MLNLPPFNDGRHARTSGFSLIEVLIVVTLIAFVYGVALPQLNLRSGAEIANKVNQLASDIRSAYDLSVLSGKTYRLVFMLQSGEYWLEEADQERVFLGDERLDRDPTEAEEKDDEVAFESRFAEFQELAGRAVTTEDDKEIPPESPVMKARDALKRPKWTRVQSMEWNERSLGPFLIIRNMQAEHHGRKQDLRELGAEARGMIYFFPHGYVEQAVIQIAYRKGDTEVDEDQEGYTVVTDPFGGTADINDGWIEIDVHARKTDS